MFVKPQKPQWFQRNLQGNKESSLLALFTIGSRTAADLLAKCSFRLLHTRSWDAAWLHQGSCPSRLMTEHKIMGCSMASSGVLFKQANEYSSCIAAALSGQGCTCIVNGWELKLSYCCCPGPQSMLHAMCCLGS